MTSLHERQLETPQHQNPPSSDLRAPDSESDDAGSHDDGFAWDNDDACLHFNPGPSGLAQPKIHSIPSIPSPKSKEPILNKTRDPKMSSRKQTPKKATKGDVMQVVSPENTSTPKRRGRRAKRLPEEDETDEIWERKMKEKILADNDLHLRILRYEV